MTAKGINVIGEDSVMGPTGMYKSIRRRLRFYSAAALMAASGLFGLVAHTDTVYANGESWTGRTAAEANRWYGIAYGNGIFVATAGNGSNRIMTSPDGITWTSRAAPEANNWYTVTYGNGLFVAVATNWVTATNSVMTSPDGITWTLRTAIAAQWESVTYGNGMFVATSTGGGSAHYVMTSPDGITWTSRTPAQASGWRSVTYGNGLFVAVSITGAVMTSPDGITWTSQSAPGANSLQGVTYGNGLFVAVGNNGVSVITSQDGVNWTARTPPESLVLYKHVTYGDGLFVAVANGGVANANRIMTSPDGITWTGRAAPEANNWYQIAYGNGLFVAVAADGAQYRVMTSGHIRVYNRDTVAMHGHIIDRHDNQPVPYAEVNLTCGEGMGVVVQADGTGAYSFTMGELYDAIDNNCAFAGGIGMFATAEGYDNGEEEWSEDRGEEDWEEWIATYSMDEEFDFHLMGAGGQENNENNNATIDGNTASLTTSTGSKAVTLTVDEGCTLSDVSAINAANTATKDAAYRYVTGFVQFTTAGCDSDSVHVQLLYHDTVPDGLTVRKYNPKNNAYFTISNATMSKVNNDTLVSYTITDNGDLDTNPAVGVITDPVGLGNLSVGAPNTGLGGRR